MGERLLDDVLAGLVGAAQHEQGGVFHGDHVRRARLVVNEGEFAELLADAEDAQDDLTAVVGDGDHLHAAFATKSESPGSSSKRMTLLLG